jgi:hypothetical protein
MSNPRRLQSIAGPIAIGNGRGMFTGTCTGHAAYYHPGDNPGYPSFAGWIPDRSASVVIRGCCPPLSNRSAGGLVTGRHDDEEE